MEKVFAARRRSQFFSAAAHKPPAKPIPPSDAHAETFYLQKQAQTQTMMVIILEGGERIEGVIEWYDRDTIKVRHGTRTLIYKSCIKYLYKSSESRFI